MTAGNTNDAWYEDWFGEDYLKVYPHRDEAEARQQVDFVARILPLASAEIQRIAPFESHRFGIKQQVQIRRGFEKLATRIRVFAALLQELIEFRVNGTDHLIETIQVGLVALVVILATTG